jgi:hypothetical protein
MAGIARVATFLREENVNTYLQGRKITTAQDHQRPSVEILHLIRKLRWIGMKEEAERVGTQLHETTLAGGVITAAHETDQEHGSEVSFKMGIASSQMALPAVLRTTSEQRTGS